MNKIEDKIAQFFIEREGEGIMETISEIDFQKSGILDSLDMITLAYYIETEFDVKLDLSDNEVYKDMLRYDTLISLIEKSVK